MKSISTPTFNHDDDDQETTTFLMENPDEQDQHILITKTIYLNGTAYPLTYLANQGHIRSKDFETETQKLFIQVSPTTRDIILATVPVTYAQEEQLTDLNLTNLPQRHNFHKLVKIADAHTALQCMDHYAKGNRGFKKFDIPTGLINITWHGGKLISPYIKIRDSTYIPIDYLSKMTLSNSDTIPTITLRGWEKTFILLESAKITSSIHRSSHYKDIRVAGIDTIMSETRTIIRATEIFF